MNDQERMTDFLFSEKKMSTNYNTFASECTSIPLRDQFLKLIQQSHQNQTDLFQSAASKGWYAPQQAPADQIAQAHTKYTDQKPQ